VCRGWVGAWGGPGGRRPLGGRCQPGKAGHDAHGLAGGARGVSASGVGRGCPTEVLIGGPGGLPPPTPAPPVRGGGPVARSTAFLGIAGSSR